MRTTAGTVYIWAAEPKSPDHNQCKKKYRTALRLKQLQCINMNAAGSHHLNKKEEKVLSLNKLNLIDCLCFNAFKSNKGLI